MTTNDIHHAQQLIAEINVPTERPRWAWWAPVTPPGTTPR